MRKVEGERRPLKMRTQDGTQLQSEENTTSGSDSTEIERFRSQSENKKHTTKHKIKFSIALHTKYIKFIEITVLLHSFDWKLKLDYDTLLI
jgi:hypothetical protein